MNTDALRQYKELRTQVVDFITEADAALAENAATRGNAWGTELKDYGDKVANDRFELVIIGAFQSGKSTLFNYLCDGRELSPVGFGIRTSGCKVSAHYVETAEEEKAVLAWRSPAELLQSLGGSLLPGLMRKKKEFHAYLTETDVDLASAKDRKRLMDAAWKQLKKQDEDTRELVRLALLIAKFYPDYGQRCKQGTTETSFEEATRIASYPSNWGKLWLEAEQRQNLSGFKSQDVAFAFVSAVDIYIKSPMLKGLGCSVTDSPGLFISEWDTAIAEKCLRKADAVLFTFSGEKAMTAEEKRVLRECVRTGVRDKIILGANLKIPDMQWQRILTESVVPDLIHQGFESPVVISYQAALALHAREHKSLSGSGLFLETRKAIDEKIAQRDGAVPDTDAQRKKYLEKRMNHYLGTLTDGEESWLDYVDMEDPALHDKLEERSGAPAFINAANNIMAPRKSRSVLIEQGVMPALGLLEQMTAESQNRLASLNQDIETKRQKLKEEKAKVILFEKRLDTSVRSIKNQVQISKLEITKHFQLLAAHKFDERKELILDNLRSILEIDSGRVAAMIFIRKRMKRLFTCAIESVFNEILEELRMEVAANFTRLQAFDAVRHTFEDERERLKKDVESLESIASISNIRISIAADYGQASRQMAMNSVMQICEKMADEYSGFTNVVLNLMTLGVRDALRYMFKGKNMPEKLLEEHKLAFQKMLGAAVENGLKSDGAPFQLIDNKVEEFSNAFKKSLQSSRKLMKEIEMDLERAEGKRELMDALAGQIESGSRLLEQGRGLLKECEAFCAEPA